MSDATIEKLQREVTTGGPAERIRLLQALLRAGRPLADAWPEGGIAVSLDENYRTEAVLKLIAQIDVPRLRHGLATEGAVFLADLGGDNLRASLDVGTVRISNHEFDYDYDRKTQRWEDKGWRWRYDAPAYVELVAVSPDGTRGAVKWAGSASIRIGGVDDLVSAATHTSPAGSRLCRWALPAPLIAVGFDGVETLIVTESHLYRHTAGNSPTALELPFTTKVAGFGSDGGSLFVSDGRAVASIDPNTGAVLWQQDDLRIEYHAIDALVPGERALAVCVGDVLLRTLGGGHALGAAERTTRIRVWEDPESTMGMGRDRREYTEYGPSFKSAAWFGEALVTVSANCTVQQWKVSRDRRTVRRVREHNRSPSFPLVVANAARVGALASEATLLAFGTHTWERQLPAPAQTFTACGPDSFLIGLRNGSLIRVDAKTGTTA
jgi:hypothetical protein